jgi:molecular chaperone HtpG
MSDGDTFSILVDFERILQTISASIYDNQYAFLRENVQNAIDAVRIQATRDRTPPDDERYRIDVEISENICSISDNGIGMTKEELSDNFWTMGASGKTTAEAKQAGCIGVFGIGGFANFGVCETLEVVSRTDKCRTGHLTSLSRSAFRIERYSLPQVQYRETEELRQRGTVVRGIASEPFDPEGLVRYLRQFVRFVREPVYAQGKLISQEKMDRPRGTYRKIVDSLTAGDADLQVSFNLFADEGQILSARILNLTIGGQVVRCDGYIRLLHGQLEVYKRGFRICAVTVASRIGVSGTFDADILQPTAGRDTLEVKSSTLLNRLFRLVEIATWPIILADADLLANHTRLLSDFIAHGNLDKLGHLAVMSLDKRPMTLDQVHQFSEQGRRIFFTRAGNSSSAAEVLQARGHLIISVSSDPQRRSAEIQFLTTYCKAEQFDNLIECLDLYTNLEPFERAILAELDLAIRKLFSPPSFRFTAGKLTLDAPIYWTNKKDGDSTVVFVDTRHGEFLKLKPLGYSSLFWSMIEAFCREYLSDTLKRQSTKFFGSGAVDLDAYSKSHAELWELLSTDIEISRIQSPSGVAPASSRHAARIEVYRRSDVQQITISSTTGVTAHQPDDRPADAGKVRLPKLLHIVDETRLTGLEGYYLRIPESATAAFGQLIRGFPAFVIVWFANRITWQSSDLKTTAFLFDITLDRLIKSDGSGTEVAHGALELGSTKIQTFNDQIYFYIPPAIESYLVPAESQAIKIELRHELLDLDRPRSWTSRETTGAQ